MFQIIDPCSLSIDYKSSLIQSITSQQTVDRTISRNDAKANRTRYRSKLHVKCVSNMLQFVPSLPDYK